MRSKSTLLLLALSVALSGAVWHLATAGAPQQAEREAALAPRPVSAGGGYLALEPGSAPQDCWTPGRTTVVGLLSQRPAEAWDLERALLTLSINRPDVAVRVVPSGGEGGSPKGVYIFGPTGRLLAGDGRGSQEGTALLVEWLGRSTTVAAPSVSRR